VSLAQRLTFVHAKPIGQVDDETHEAAQMPPFAGSGDKTQTPVSHWSAVAHFAAMGSFEQEPRRKRLTTETRSHGARKEGKEITRRPFSSWRPS
jgi:hypothetical protein